MPAHRKTKKEYDRDISNKYDEDLESLDFITTKHTVTIRCKNCGYTQYFTKAANFLYSPQEYRKGFCPNCRKEKRQNKRTYEDFLREVKIRNHNADNFEFLTGYINRDNLIKARCLKCNSVFERNARAFPLDRDCPCCSYKRSHGESYLMSELTKLKYTYINNYVDTRLDNRKSFDFKVFLNENDYFYIEFDGIQHFEYNEYLHHGDITNLEIQKKNDEIKNNFCKENKIPLLCIRYDEYENIPQILNNFILECSTTRAEARTQ